MNKNKIKILFVTNYYLPVVGGISTYIKSLREGLDKNKYDTEIIFYPLSFRQWEAKIKSQNMKKLFRLLFILSFIFIAELKIFKNKLANNKIIVHSHSAGFCLVIGVISTYFGCKSIHTFHSPIGKRVKYLEKVIPKADALIFVSEEALELYRTYGRIENKRIGIIPGVIDQNKYYPRSKKEIVKLKKDLTKVIGEEQLRNKLILFVGRVVEIKGLLPLVKSVKIVKQSYPEISVIIVGPHFFDPEDEEYYENLMSYIKTNKLEKYLNFAGMAREDLIIKLNAVSDLFVCPSLWEASGIVAVEAMASGKPVIGTRVGGLQHIIENGKTGYLVEKNNPEELAKRILDLLKNEKNSRKMGANARKYVEKNLSLEGMLEKYERIYEEIAED